MPQATKKRIGLAITLGEQGGAQVFLLGFARWLKRHEYEPILIVGDGDWLKERAPVYGIEYHQLHHFGREISLLRDPRAYVELRSVLNALELDAIHLNSSKMGAIGSLAARRAEIPRIVYCIGGWAFLEPMSTWKRRLYTFIERVSARWKDVIICVHPGDVEVAKNEHIRPASLVMIPNGVDTDMVRTQQLEREGARLTLAARCQTAFPADVQLVGTIANFFPAKDLVRYMHACALVSSKLPNTRFIILGDGMQRAEIEAERRRLALEDIVFLPGSMEQGWRYLSAFDIHCLPSCKEGMSLTVLEAMAAGVPNVVTDVGANRWMLDGHGLVVPPRDAVALADGLENLLKDGERRHACARKAQKHVEQMFQAEQMYTEQAKQLGLSV